MKAQDAQYRHLHQVRVLYDDAYDRGEVDGYRYGFDDFRLVVFSAVHRCVVAVEGDDVLGFLLAYDHATWGYVDIIIVRERDRWRGVASALVQKLFDDPRHWKTLELCHRMLPTGAGAEKLCNKLGFDSGEFYMWRSRRLKED